MCNTPSLVWVRLCDLGLCFRPSLCLRSVLSSCPKVYIFYVFMQNTASLEQFPLNMCDTLRLVRVCPWCLGISLCPWLYVQSILSSCLRVFSFVCYYTKHSTKHRHSFAESLHGPNVSTELHNWHTLGIDRYDTQSISLPVCHVSQTPLWALSLHIFCIKAFPWHYLNAMDRRK